MWRFQKGFLAITWMDQVDLVLHSTLNEIDERQRKRMSTKRSAEDRAVETRLPPP